jgi:hypothetical protein
MLNVRLALLATPPCFEQNILWQTDCASWAIFDDYQALTGGFRASSAPWAKKTLS